MQATTMIWKNGQLIPWQDAVVHVLAHTLHYGAGAFEGIRFYNTADGPAVFRLEEHVDRLLYSASVLKMSVAYSKAEIIDAIKEVVRVNQITSGYIRPLLFYGAGQLTLNPASNPVEFIIACWPWGAYLPHESIDVKVSNYIRIHPDSTVVDAKICGHYVNSILATIELQGTHYHEALLLDSNGYIAEGVGENFFIVKNGVIYTPKLGSILSGITRDTLINIAQHLNFNVIETDISLDTAYQADEAFFTGTAAEVTPIRSINDKVLGKKAVGDISAKLKQKYHAVITGNCSKFKNYLTIVA